MTADFYERGRREGLLALEDDLEAIGDDLFREAIQLIVDGTDPEIIDFILSNYIEHEHDYYKKKLKILMREGVLFIQQGGEFLPNFLIRMNSLMNIKDDKLSAACAEYLNGTMDAFDRFLKHIPNNPPVREREEVRFIKHAVYYSETARRKGLLALDDILNRQAIAERDIFEYGIPFVIDGEDPAFIDSVLSNLVLHETDPARRNLLNAKKTAVLSLQAGDNPRILAKKLCSFFDRDIERIVQEELDRDDSVR
jgi:flagellar motor component MotA